MKGLDDMTTAELIDVNLEEFNRIQSYLSLVLNDTTTNIYKTLVNRYHLLKAKLNSYGVNLEGIDTLNIK